MSSGIRTMIILAIASQWKKCKVVNEGKVLKQVSKLEVVNSVHEPALNEPIYILTEIQSAIIIV